jgi:hypothetical protein
MLMRSVRMSITNSKPTEVKGSKVEEHVPIFQHKCPKHDWERCGLAASLVDPSMEARHACSKKPTAEQPKQLLFNATAREIAE